jgi:hypothetical protein
VQPASISQRYRACFTFRFNRRKSKSCGKLFYRLAQQAVLVNPVPFATLVKPQPAVSGGLK